MLTTDEILSTLDNCDKDEPFNFINLGHPYLYLIDCRLNIFRNNTDKWAIVSEILSYNNRSSGYAAIGLEIRYFGNCLINLDVENGKYLNYYNTFPVSPENFDDTIDDIDLSLKPGAESWLVKDTYISLSHNKQAYINGGIKLKEFEPDRISAEEVCRLVVQKHRGLFRATDEELYKSIPTDLSKILVIDEWYHKEFDQISSPFEHPDILKDFDITNESVRRMIEYEIDSSRKFNSEKWNDRPGSYETWQQIAKVIVTADPSFYTPTLKPNSHWSNWPEGGSM